MTFDAIYGIAVDVVNALAANRGYIEPNETVCVIVSGSGRVFNGVSRNDVHAEIEAVRNLQSFGETVIDTVILVDANSRLALLPCNSCINYMVSINPANANGRIAMPDRLVPMQEFCSSGMSMPFDPTSSRIPQTPASSRVITGRAKGDLLKNKVGTIVDSVGEAEDEDDELIQELKTRKKGFLGGLFGGGKK